MFVSLFLAWMNPGSDERWERRGPLWGPVLRNGGNLCFYLSGDYKNEVCYPWPAQVDSQIRV